MKDKKEKKRHTLRIRVSDSEYKDIQEMCERLDYTESQFIRFMLGFTKVFYDDRVTFTQVIATSPIFKDLAHKLGEKIRSENGK